MCVCVCASITRWDRHARKQLSVIKQPGSVTDSTSLFFIGLAFVNNPTPMAAQPYSGPETSSYLQKPDKPRDDVCIMVTEGEAVHP